MLFADFFRICRLPRGGAAAAVFCFFAALFASGCSYKSEIRQGNDALPDVINLLRPGMDRAEVRELLGDNRAPAVFEREGEVYYYRRRTAGFFPKVEEWSVRLTYENDKLARIETLLAEGDSVFDSESEPALESETESDSDTETDS